MLRRLLVLLLAAPLLAQSPTSPPASDAQTKIRVNSDLVILPVTVKNQFGELVPDLEQSDFRVFDQNVEQSIDVFTAEAFPLSLVILIDDDLKSKDAAQMAPTLRAITAGISANDEALVCRFDLDFYPGDAFSSDLDKLWADLKNVEGHSGPSSAGPVPYVTAPSAHPEGVGEPKQTVPIKSGSRATKALDDAIHSAATLLHDRGIARRKIILVVSDGVNGALIFSALRGASVITASVVSWGSDNSSWLGPFFLGFLAPVTLAIVDMATTPHREQLAPHDPAARPQASRGFMITGLSPAPTTDAQNRFTGATLHLSAQF